MDNTKKIIVPLGIPLGTETKWGTIGAIGTTGGERYYWILDKDGGVAMLPASVVER